MGSLEVGGGFEPKQAHGTPKRLQYQLREIVPQALMLWHLGPETEN